MPGRDQDGQTPETITDDGARLGARVKRFAKVGTSVGGLAARVAGNRLFGLPLDKARHSLDLKEALGSLKGPVMKVAQILATIPDALPKEYAQELRELQSNAPAMGWLFVKRRMKSELGAAWQGRFAKFNHDACAAASLGQVHCATLPNGQQVACKLQYPDMASVVEADLQQLRLIFSIYKRYDSAIDPSDIYKELAERLREELDYEREAKQMALYGHILAEESSVHVPKPYADYSTPRLLTMSWLQGSPLLQVAEREADSQEMRNRIALNMFRAWYCPFYGYGVIHGDPHLGNYSICSNGNVNLLDFGCIRVFPPRFVRGVINLYFALEGQDEALEASAYEDLGFKNLTPELRKALNIWAGFIYGPILTEGVRPIVEDERGGLYGAKVANRVHQELKRIGGIRPPREFVLLDRAAVGLGSVFMHLKAEVNWHDLFHSMIQDFDCDDMAQRQQTALLAAGLARPAQTAGTTAKLVDQDK